MRHKSGRYYVRTFSNNKEIWKTLRTDHFSVAKARLAEFLREHGEKQVRGLQSFISENDVRRGARDSSAKRRRQRDNQADDAQLLEQVFAALLKSWSGLGGA